MPYYKLSLDGKTNRIWQINKFCRILKRKKFPTKPIEIVFQMMLTRFRRVRTLETVYSKLKITQILDEVIRNDYFGTTQNRKRFYHLVNRITTQSRFECIYKSNLYKGYDLKVIPWLQKENLDDEEARVLLMKANTYLLEYIVAPLIKHFYHPLKSFKDYEVKFIERKKWHSFQQKNLHHLLTSRHLLPVKNVTPRGVLRIFPKTDCDSLEFRPIILPFKRDMATRQNFKRISRQIECLARSFSSIGRSSLFDAWEKYCRWACDDDIFGIKLDVRDAFGSVDIVKLCEVLKCSSFKVGEKQFVINHIQNQFVTYNKKMYKWNHGLLQGDHLSSSLCNLYISVLEKENFQAFLKEGIFLHRIVDDYMFCSSEEHDVYAFEKKCKEIFQLNESKTEKAGFSGNAQIGYYGQVFHLETRMVGKLYNYRTGFPIRHKFKLWNIKRPIPENAKQQFILNTLQFSYNNHCFKRLDLNTIFNTEQQVLLNYFKGMIFIAFKFDAAVMSIREFKEVIENMPYLLTVLNTVVSNFSNIVFYKINQCKGINFKGCITFKLLKNIGYRAFICVLKKNNEFYKILIKSLEKKDHFYMYLNEFQITPKTFMVLPSVFSSIKMNRNSRI
ncbi:telomerase reverse transcriptase [Leptinotarsa decemlineata]|uniref:telomerase reverse transcriptase n=1 Tax=Leptinotarsa decemlineata TaxID=7539 RepID=UPI003D304269